jgi:hypothetical protein
VRAFSLTKRTGESLIGPKVSDVAGFLSAHR